ncbi:hypothetical protein [Kribbella sp. NPDC023855]|uniref:RICIN domain-containing protein n=1 Tax=Kribbella sp. NPDC023855 TaxID=3154698 RepID=UPI0033C030BA
MVRKTLLSLAALTTVSTAVCLPAGAASSDSSAAAETQYKIVSAAGSPQNVLTAAPNSSGFTPDVFLFDNPSLTRQKWKISRAAGDTSTVVIENVGNPGECLSVLTGSTGVYSMTCDDSLAQRWKVPAAGAATAQPIISAQTNDALTRLQGNPDFSPIAVRSTFTGAPDQLFKIIASSS